ncbi:hypothetical protein ABZ568_00860 [Streptomyces olindensis]|uniref:Uncharacterized protein n=1 Tax=Streptomyces olindensis TaxID=358823 RepID=A0ABV2XMC9_9ACTN
MTERPNGFDRFLGLMAGHQSDEPAGEDKLKEITREEIDRTRNQLTSSLMAFSELMGPIFDHADGIRADLVRREWSPQAAEQVALVWLINSVQNAVGGWARQ